MRFVFVDASHYIAILLPRDRLHAAAIARGKEFNDSELVTAEPVLVEVLAHVSRLGEHTRSEAVGLVDDLHRHSRVRIISQTHELFEDGLSLYRDRLDKAYSLTDCMSMSICRRLGVADVLTHDGNFQQEGFSILL